MKVAQLKVSTDAENVSINQERFPPYFPAVRDAQARKPLSTVPNTKLAWERSAECHGSQIERPKSCTSRDSDSPVLHVSAHRPSSTSQLHHKFEFEPIAPAAGGVESVGVGFSAVMQTKPRPPHAMPPRQRTLRPCAPPGSSPCVLEDVSSPPRFRPSPPPPPHLSPSPPPPLLAAAAASVPWADEHDDDDDDAVFGSIVLGCGHEECVASLRRRALTPSTTALTCDSCSHPVNDSLIRGVLTPEEFDKYLEASLHGLLSIVDQVSHSPSFVKCPDPQCGAIIEVLKEPPRVVLPALPRRPRISYRDSSTPGMKQGVLSKLRVRVRHWLEGFEKPAPAACAVPSPLETGLDGLALSPTARQHRDQHRMRCSGCEHDFCMKCNAMPYHIGFDCSNYEEWKRSAKCRYCKVTMRGTRTVCTGSECVAKARLACGKTLSCGHPCGGVKGERACLPCLHSECAPDADSATTGTCCGAGGPTTRQLPMAQSGDDYCPICYVETLEDAPAIHLQCGHIVHVQCAKDKLANKWSGSRISFAFLGCPVCSATMMHGALEPTITQLLALKGKVEGLALKRLQHEGLSECTELTNSASEYFGKPSALAMKLFSYYLCSTCEAPYFGGKASCEAGRGGDAPKEELVCEACNRQTSDRSSCKPHGKQFVEYKCRYCCSLASWFCWGTSHFCTSCHARQMGGEFLNLLPVSELPKCDPAKCPLRGAHPPNGTECAIGCRICRADTEPF